MKDLTMSELKDQYTSLYQQVQEGKGMKDSEADKIQKKQYDNIEALDKDDPIEVWITGFLSSGDPQLEKKTKEEVIKIAVGAYYGSQTNRERAFDTVPREIEK